MQNLKSFFNKINLLIRSSLFLIFSVIGIVIYSFIVLFSAVFPLHVRHIIIRSFLRADLAFLSFICHIEYEIEGLENIPKNGNGIVLSKHQSTWETFFLPLIFHDPAPVAKKELLWVPFFGWGLAISDPIVIDRKQKKTAMQQIIEQGKKRLDKGRWIIMFPEGTRVPPGVIGKYKSGGARLAAATGYPVIPIAHNAGRCWPRRQFIKRPGKIHLVIGPPIESKNRTPDQILELTKSWIETTMRRIDGFVNKPSSQ